MIRVSSTNSSKGSCSFVRVYLNDKKVAEVQVSRRNPLAYLKTLKNSKHKKSLAIQLFPHGLKLKDIGL